VATRLDITPASDRELVLRRLVDAPRAKVWRCWTEAELLKQWFCPRPWTTPMAQMDVRPGGAHCMLMKGPNPGEEHLMPGVFLDVVPQERLVFTDAFVSAWEPSEKPFMVATLQLDAQGDMTVYTARVWHWSVADREEHEKMGFHDGWGTCVEQLEEVARGL
jgi:uncharacterized protein YndB with AHSA1/START domain